MSIPNWIAALRLIAIPFIIISTVLNLQGVTGWIILIAWFTDAIDGPIARHYKWTSPFGARLDSVADCSLFVACFCSLLYFFYGFMSAHWWQVSLLIGLYLFQLVFSIIKFRELTSLHTYAAKVAAIVESFFIIVCFFYQPIEWLFYIVWAIGLIEQTDEISLLFILPHLEQNVKGIYWVLKQKKSSK